MLGALAAAKSTGRLSSCNSRKGSANPDTAKAASVLSIFGGGSRRSLQPEANGMLGAVAAAESTSQLTRTPSSLARSPSSLSRSPSRKESPQRETSRAAKALSIFGGSRRNLVPVPLPEEAGDGPASVFAAAAAAKTAKSFSSRLRKNSSSPEGTMSPNPRALSRQRSFEVGRSRNFFRRKARSITAAMQIAEQAKQAQQAGGALAAFSAAGAAHQDKLASAEADKETGEDDRENISSLSYLTEDVPKKDLKRVLLPWAPLRMTWDCIGFAMITYTSVVVPIQVSFASEIEPPFLLMLADGIIDLFFVFDIILNLHTAYVTDAGTRLVYDKTKIRRHYVRTWFIVDLLASVPWEIALFTFYEVVYGREFNSTTATIPEVSVDVGSGEAALDLAGTAREKLGALKLLKLVKIFRMGRVIDLVLGLLKRVGSMAKIVLLVAMLSMVTHWLCCQWYLLTRRAAGEGRWRDDNDAPGLDAFVYEQHAFYFYTILMAIMGDNIGPTDRVEVVFVGFCVFLGACVNAVVFAQVAFLVSQMSAASAYHANRMAQVNRALIRVGARRKTADRVRAYYEYRWRCHRDHEVEKFVTTLPAQLRSDVSCLLHWRLIRRCPLFGAADRRLVAAVTTTLKPEVYLPSEFILVAGYLSSCMYFISKGKVLVVERPADENAAPQEMTANGEVDHTSRMSTEAVEEPKPKGLSKLALLKSAAKRVSSGTREDYFGERGLFSLEEQRDFDETRAGQNQTRYDTSARAITHCDVYKLMRSDFDKIVVEYPQPAMRLVTTAQQLMAPDFAAIFKAKIFKIANPKKVEVMDREATSEEQEAAAKMQAIRRGQQVRKQKGATGGMAALIAQARKEKEGKAAADTKKKSDVLAGAQGASAPAPAPAPAVAGAAPAPSAAPIKASCPPATAEAAATTQRSDVTRSDTSETSTLASLRAPRQKRGGQRRTSSKKSDKESGGALPPPPPPPPLAPGHQDAKTAEQLAGLERRMTELLLLVDRTNKAVDRDLAAHSTSDSAAAAAAAAAAGAAQVASLKAEIAKSTRSPSHNAQDAQSSAQLAELSARTTALLVAIDRTNQAVDKAANENALHVASLRADMQRLTKSQAAVVAHLQAASQPPPSPPQPYTRANPGPSQAAGFSYAGAASQQQSPPPPPPATVPAAAATASGVAARQEPSPQQRSPQQRSPQPQSGASPGLQDFAWWQDDSKAWQQKHKELAAELGLTPAGLRQNAMWGAMEC